MSSKSKIGWFLLSGASLAAMGALSPAMAQDDVSEEIVVTATGRAAAIQDVPLAVTAVGGETLENTGARDLRDVTQVAPSLVMGTGQSNSSGTTAYIRGIGTGSDNPGFEAAVGIFVDGVYRARAGAALADLPDLERVEILRGPQGTLYGRNTSAGAISVITAGPDYEPGMYLEGTYGLDDLEETGARGGVNIPVSDTLAFRFDGTIRARDGYITDVITGDDVNTRDRWTARAQGVWDITSDASLRVIVDGSETDEVCCGITPLQYGSTQAVVSLLTGGAGTIPIDPEARQMTITPGRGYGEQTDEWGISGQLDWDLGGINLTSITAYRDWSAVRDQDIDFNVIDVAYRDGLEVGFKNFTQELRLQGEWNRVNWLLGVFYGDEQLDTTDRIRLGTTANLYTNTATIGNTDPFVPGAGTGCELFDFVPGATFPSVFQCVAGAIGVPALQLAVNGVNGGYLNPAAAGQGQQDDNWQIDTQSLALFTHNEISITDDLVLTVGVRYNQETKDLTADLFATNTTCDSLRAMELGTDGIIGAQGIVYATQTIDPDGAGPLGAGALSPLMNLACNPAVNNISNGLWTGDSEENEFSGTVSLAYHLTDDVLLYGGYSRGYKAGGFNVDRSGFQVSPATTSVGSCAVVSVTGRVCVDDLRFEPEFTDAFELGMKSTIFGGTTTVNIAAFYQQIHDYQLNAFNGFNFITRNIPEAISQGAEIEISARPTDNLTLTGGVVYTDAYYDSTVVFNPFDPGPNTVVAGTPFSFSSEWTVNGGINYETPITNNLRANFYLDGRWNNGYRVQTLARNPASDNDAFAIFNGRISIAPESDHWSLEFWGRNLTDEFYHVGAFQPTLQNSTVIYPNEPATYGVTLRLRS